MNRSAEEWTKALESEDTAEVLATLTWLNGEHLNPNQSESSEPSKEAQLAFQLRFDKSIKATLKRLLQSNNRWIKEAAKLPIETE